MAGVNAGSNACAVVIALAGSCQGFCEVVQLWSARLVVRSFLPELLGFGEQVLMAFKLLKIKRLILCVGFGGGLRYMGHWP